jgi:hypothetical protein
VTGLIASAKQQHVATRGYFILSGKKSNARGREGGPYFEVNRILKEEVTGETINVDAPGDVRIRQ